MGEEVIKFPGGGLEHGEGLIEGLNREFKEELGQRIYNVKQWTEMPRGGHFAALEEPLLLSNDIKTFFKKLV